jgi:hypothetical protein
MKRKLNLELMIDTFGQPILMPVKKGGIHAITTKRNHLKALIKRLLKLL